MCIGKFYTLNMAQLKFLSLNCHGFNKATLCYLQSVITDYDIVLLQETWLSNQTSHVLDNIHPGFNVYHTSAMEHKLTSGLVTGRPFGGTAILVRENVFKQITPLTVNTVRATAICCSSPGQRNLVVMSVYMPWDDRSLYQHDEYVFTVGCIQAIVDAHPDCNFLFGGDWNLCKNGRYSAELCVRRFCTDNQFCWVDTCTDRIDYTYHNDNNDHYSLIDHFICSANLIHEGDKTRIMIDGLNTSDHFAISLKVNQHTWSGGSGKSAPSVIKLRWDRANVQLYQSECTQLLSTLNLPTDALY